ncbi:GTP-binding protein [Thermocrinis jamiesonii]|jgi:small GTP-binding protein domain|uniref:GTP-binding protein n=1 Tax=Thermocrinis jamiesonii TaxID=1302351 RepID=UPI000498174D|nr:ATP/GTP-binding protein [Thermocrinis jamiesonii]
MKTIKKIKIVVAGPFAAGKTQFINTVSEIKTVKTERRTQQPSEKSVKDYTTVAMDFGKIRIDDEHELYLFGTPGQFRFDFMWEILGEGALGIIILVDSTDPSTFHEARKIINFFQSRFPVPMVVGANKQDLPNAWSPRDVMIALDISEEEGIPVIPVSAIDKESVKKALLTLLEIVKSNLTS